MRAESADCLDRRARYLLRVLIQRYINDGHPVGSRTLLRDAGLDLSSATIRSVMADLEQLGLLHSPHTSAGRLPTVQGYRFFVDSLMQLEPLSGDQIAQLRSALDPHTSTDALLRSAGSLLSGSTDLAGVVLVPRRNSRSLRQIEFMPLAENRVLAILVFSEREVQNRIVMTDRSYSAAELQQMANYLNAEVLGGSLYQVRERLLNAMRHDQQQLDLLMRAVVDMADKVFDESDFDSEDVMVSGQTNLMGENAIDDVDRLRQLFEAFGQKRELVHLLDRCIDARGLKIFIGDEAGVDVLEECSLVTAPYRVDGEVLGVLGVIGPTRIAYERIVPIVEVTAQLLSTALNSDT